ncbi:MAG: hypothetical protein K2J47_10840 [Ruminococcus sp.]|nr:hypothetical protein [Ruminococcus sp.]
MKKSVTVSVEAEKLTALEMYLGQKNLKLSEELARFSEQLYQKYVPSNVREFIELTTAKKLPRKAKNAAPTESENQSEQ